MAWTDSRVFAQWVIGPMMQAAGTSYAGLDADAVKVALFGSGVTPDKDAAVASTGYNTGTWLLANEVSGGANWAAGGRTLATPTFTSPGSGIAMFDAADLAGGGTVTLTNAFGCLVYDDTISGGTVADQGVCFNYFGGSQSVTNGTFQVIWNSSGIVRFTV